MDMTPFTVEAVTKPVYSEDGWLPIRRITDLVPGCFLIEDPEEPTLVMPVNSSAAARAALFVEGVLKLVGVELVAAKVHPADEDGPLELSPEAELVHDWAENVPPFVSATHWTQASQ
ncbi:MAG: hypothetical protein K2Q25_07985 [Mycobacteriaceae bacterium]|nr:hypothetical protein [Mycobacteriaceae bacterium]